MQVDPSIPPDLRARVERHGMLERVLRDGFDVEDVVVQDEFTHVCLEAGSC